MIFYMRRGRCERMLHERSYKRFPGSWMRFIPLGTWENPKTLPTRSRRLNYDAAEEVGESISFL
jgi:hypothetical protein